MDFMVGLSPAQSLSAWLTFSCFLLGPAHRRAGSLGRWRVLAALLVPPSPSYRPASANVQVKRFESPTIPKLDGTFVKLRSTLLENDRIQSWFKHLEQTS